MAGVPPRCWLPLVVWTLAFGGCSPGGPPGEQVPALEIGVVVEEVPAAFAAARAGVRAGDQLVAWERTAPGGAVVAGRLADPFDLREVEIEQSDRGPVRLRLRRAGGELAVDLVPGPWGITGRPALAPAELRNYRTVPEAPPAAAARWGRIADALAARNESRAGAWFCVKAGQHLAASTAWREASPFFDRARDLARAAGDPLVEAAVLELHAEALGGRLPPDGEARLWEEALALRRAAGGDGLAVAHDLLRLGRVRATRAGDRAGGLELVEESLALRRRVAPGSLAVAAASSGLGILASIAGDYAIADRRFGEALEIIERVAPGSPVHANVLNNLGLGARRQGRLAEAQGYLERSLSIHEALDPGSDDTAGTVNNLGVIARRRGRLAEAESYWLRALSLRRAREPGGLGTLTVLGNLANLAFQRGDLERALALERENLALRRRVEPRGEKMVVTLSVLADILIARGRLDEAEPLLREALAMADEETPRAPYPANLRRALGDLARRRGDRRAARELLVEARERIARIAPGSLDEAACLSDLAALETDEGDLLRGRELLLEAREIHRRWAVGSILEAESLDALAKIARRQGRVAEAIDLYRQALAALDSQLSLLGGDDPARARFGRRMAPIYRDATLLLVAQGEDAAAFEVLERYRARGLLELLADRDLLIQADLPAELATAREEIRAEQEQARDAFERAGQANDSSRLLEASARLGAIEQRRRELGEAIRRANPRLADLRDPRPLTAEEAVGTLEPGTVLLSYVVGEDASAVIALRSNGAAGGPRLRAAAIEATAAELEVQIDAFRSLLQNRRPSRATGAAIRERGQALFDLLLAPVGEELVSAAALLVLPDGPLHGLSFSALVGPDGRFLVERIPVTTSLSASLRARLPRPASSSARAVVLADPAPPSGAAARAPLPASRFEAAAFAARVPAATVFEGARASEARVKTLPRPVRVLHLAAHGVVDDRFPLESYLVLAAGSGEDGLLRAWEVFEQVRCPGSLVVLSACETGLGPNLGGEGMIGLTRSFHYAGASTVVSSLWQVSDRSTAALMAAFYEAIEDGAGPAEALRRAQLALLLGEARVPRAPGDSFARLLDGLGLGARARPLDLSAPFHWAAFQAHGR